MFLICMMEKRRQGQVTLFIIVGIILVAMFVIIGVLKNKQVKDSDIVPQPSRGNTGDSECRVDTDCVPQECCHAPGCVPREKAPDCSGMLCTLECAPGTLDCGQGTCTCENSRCAVLKSES